MEPEALRSYLLGFPEVSEETPFGPDAVVYKTDGKMFALTDWDTLPLRINLKCDPERAQQLRDTHRCVEPGYHMNKKHWNTVTLDGSVPDAVFLEWVRHSFECVLKGMPKARQQEIRKQLESNARSESPATRERESLREDLRRGI